MNLSCHLLSSTKALPCLASIKKHPSYGLDLRPFIFFGMDICYVVLQKFINNDLSNYRIIYEQNFIFVSQATNTK